MNSKLPYPIFLCKEKRIATAIAHAGKRIEKKLKKLGMSIAKSRVSAIVKGGEGPLEDGAEETFKQIGADIAKSLQ